MRYTRKFHKHDTSERPDMHLWVDQTAIPVKDDSEWTLGTNMVASSGSLVLSASPDGEVASRNIPGVLEDHVYKVTIVLDSIDAGELDVLLGGVEIPSLTTAGTTVAYVRPTAGNLLSITVDNAASSITATISSIVIEAEDPIDIEKLAI